MTAAAISALILTIKEFPMLINGIEDVSQMVTTLFRIGKAPGITQADIDAMNASVAAAVSGLAAADAAAGQKPA